MTDRASANNDLSGPSTPDGDSTHGAAPAGHDWLDAGGAWGLRARDWACLFEHYAVDTIHAIFDRVGVVENTALLDIACGSGLAIRYAGARGARPAGIDAAAALIDLARCRNPEADLRVGTMFDLPWPNEHFDAVTSINGIWGGCEGALAEAHRVLRPGGRVGISFWGEGPPLDLRMCFRAFAVNAPDDHLRGMKRTNGIARPGVAEEMLESAGFDIVERASRVSTVEWPDEETAWRALSSLGPAVPALEHVGPEVLRPLVLEALESCRDRFGMYHFRNDHQFVIAEKAAR
jgi:SAM-dependent methyltransferase